MTTTTIAKTTIIVTTAALLLAMVAAQAPAAAPEPAAGAPGGETTGAGAPGPGGAMDDCMNKLFNMSDCLTYVQAGSNLTKPDKGCCPELAGLVESDPICLCQLLGNTSATIGIQIEINKALNLPTACAVQIPSISLCSAAGYPVPGPMSSEAPAVGYPVPGPMSSEAPDSMSPSLAASGNSGNVASSSIAASQLSVLVGLAIAFLITPFF
ncbi:Non-specific lipid transfer protein GPI-anchored 2 [Camellia lanceoleosa]|uniref:Non-specific lipid transfer protein GPI-anchored 2 n=1 Tax=Camellia lanceoleosa TaxID=1840588 RepID=A0ACC0F4A6_9ERIC|nr:Non-specific lipid transfer protein GPI-anchored 2 [Camellia lanceoleosa]